MPGDGAPKATAQLVALVRGGVQRSHNARLGEAVNTRGGRERMAGSVIVREYSPSDWEGVLLLLRQHFGRWRSERWTRRWQWQYGEDHGCRECKSFIQVAEAEGRIVGHHGAFPLPLRLGEQRIEVLCPGDFVVDAQHRWAAFAMLKNLVGQGRTILGTGWSRAASKLFRFHEAAALPLSEVRYVYQLRYQGATRRELRQRLPGYLRWMGNRWGAAIATPVLDHRRGRRSKRLPDLNLAGALRPISRFGREYDELWRAVTRQFEVSLDKDAEYLNWRYVDCPTMSPLCLGYYDERDRLAGVVIACRRAHGDVMQRPCGEDGEIVELIAREPDARTVAQMIIPVMELLDGKGVDAVAATGLHSCLHPVLEGIGFERTQCGWGTLFAISNIPDHPAHALLRDDLWYFTSGDGDHLFGPGM